MVFSRGLNVVFGNFDISELLFDACATIPSCGAFTHWWRTIPLQWLPEIPEELCNDPIRLKRIVFYYQSPLEAHDAAKMSTHALNRQRGDLIIVEQPLIADGNSLAPFLALLADFGNAGNTAVVTLSEDVDLELTATLYTPNLWKMGTGGKLQPLFDETTC